jgi:hypothetical protein
MFYRRSLKFSHIFKWRETALLYETVLKKDTKKREENKERNKEGRNGKE